MRRGAGFVIFGARRDQVIAESTSQVQQMRDLAGNVCGPRPWTPQKAVSVGDVAGHNERAFVMLKAVFGTTYLSDNRTTFWLSRY